MRWPSPQDYREAIQNPSICLSDEELRRCELEIDEFQLPVVRSGQYAAVFKLSSSRRSWAVRCFLHNFEDRAERYHAISNFIIRDDLECTVGFELVDKGIKIGSDWFPILKMEYVEGESLGSYVRKNIENPDRLRTLLSSFEEMMLALKSEGIAHGDLQHDNIVITAEARLRLIDYDGMYVPALAGFHSNELGHRNYQHPSRNETNFGPNLDNFSARVIRGALASLLEDPSLFQQLNRSEESLLLTREDFLWPESSPAFFRIEEIDGAPRLLARQIRTLLRQPVETVPFIDEDICLSDSLPEVVPAKLPVRVGRFAEPPAVAGRFAELVQLSGSASTADGAAAMSPATAPRSLSEPVLSHFKSVFLYSARSTDGLRHNVDIQSAIAQPWRLVRRDRDLLCQERDTLSALEQTLLPGEVVLWSGGLTPEKLSTEEQGQNIRANTSFMLTTSKKLCILAILCILFFVMLGFVLGLFMIIMLWPLPVAWLMTRSSAEDYLKSEGTRHLLYALTDHNLKICIRTGLHLVGHHSTTEWNVELVDIPLYLIQAVNFYNGPAWQGPTSEPVYGNNAFLTERVELEIKIPAKGSVPSSTERLWLHGFATWDRLGLKTRLRSLGIQCHEAYKP